MTNNYHIVVCAGIVPDPLQTLEPISAPAGPALKNEMMLPAVLDPWAAHALNEAANLAAKASGSKVWLVSAAPKAKLQQVMMNVAQKASFELVPIDAQANGFADAHAVAAILASAIQSIPGLDRSRLLLFGGWESASRGTGVTMQLVAEHLGIVDQFQGVDQLSVQADGSFEILERIEGGRHEVAGIIIVRRLRQSVREAQAEVQRQAGTYLISVGYIETQIRQIERKLRISRTLK